MMDYLKELQQNDLLSPIATLVAGSFAIIAVLINNWFITINLTKQLKSQSSENYKNIINEAKKTALIDKKNKLEELHEYIQQYSELLLDVHSMNRPVLLDTEQSYKDTYELLEQVNDEYRKCQNYRIKATVLGHAYSDSKDIKDSLNELKNTDENYKGYLNKLTSIYFEADIVNLDKTTVEDKTLKVMLSLSKEANLLAHEIQVLEALLITEIVNCRKLLEGGYEM
ncbi:hypothetical protein L8S13_22400 [Vibrio lentus]|uniref:hypothetical protein n=1 Tax=Vibrio lentus TaxID=136468 RepID=UPI0024699AC0|nr:hypothetical protein [Vibrio lentus]MDH5929053.1 hypothetical protein [Vibrio lentus]